MVHTVVGYMLPQLKMSYMLWENVQQQREAICR